MIRLLAGLVRWLWFGCWNHRQTIWDHDHLTCLQCGAVVEVLPQAVIRGPAHTPEPVRGKPSGKARTKSVERFEQRKRA